jgi:copper chaperone CopZ
MKTKSILIIALAMVTMFTYAKNEKVVLNVSMHCDACKTKIEKNIAFEKGVKDMQVNLEKKQVTITYDDAKTNVENLIAGFKKIGFVATIAANNNSGEKACCAEKKEGAACCKEKDAVKACKMEGAKDSVSCKKECSKEAMKCSKECSKDSASCKKECTKEALACEKKCADKPASEKAACCDKK